MLIQFIPDKRSYKTLCGHNKILCGMNFQIIMFKIKFPNMSRISQWNIKESIGVIVSHIFSPISYHSSFIFVISRTQLNIQWSIKNEIRKSHRRPRRASTNSSCRKQSCRNRRMFRTKNRIQKNTFPFSWSSSIKI